MRRVPDGDGLTRLVGVAVPVLDGEGDSPVAGTLVGKVGLWVGGGRIDGAVAGEVPAVLGDVPGGVARVEGGRLTGRGFGGRDVERRRRGLGAGYRHLSPFARGVVQVVLGRLYPEYLRELDGALPATLPPECHTTDGNLRCPTVSVVEERSLEHRCLPVVLDLRFRCRLPPVEGDLLEGDDRGVDGQLELVRVDTLLGPEHDDIDIDCRPGGHRHLVRVERDSRLEAAVLSAGSRHADAPGDCHAERLQRFAPTRRPPRCHPVTSRPLCVPAPRTGDVCCSAVEGCGFQGAPNLMFVGPYTGDRYKYCKPPRQSSQFDACALSWLRRSNVSAFCESARPVVGPRIS